MLSLVDPKNGAIRIFRIAIIDAAVISLLSWLIVIHALPMYLTTVIAIPALYIVNFLVFWKISRRHLAVAKKASEAPKVLWFAALAFTIGSIVEMVSWIRAPDFQSAVQAVVVSFLAGYIWFVLLHLRRVNRTQPDTNVKSGE